MKWTENPRDTASQPNPLSDRPTREWTAISRCIGGSPGLRTWFTQSNALSPSAARTCSALPTHSSVFHRSSNICLLLWQPHWLTSKLGFRQLTDMLITTAEYLTQEDLDVILQLAAHAGHTSRVELLVNRGADVNGEAEPWSEGAPCAEDPP
ncbi:hypothetical protein VTI74DRAFT_5645 [Chaetomium olivicolor]